MSRSELTSDRIRQVLFALPGVADQLSRATGKHGEPELNGSGLENRLYAVTKTMGLIVPGHAARGNQDVPPGPENDSPAETEARTEATEAAFYLLDLIRLFEIAGFARSGGVKAMMYRLETGNRNVTAMEHFNEVTARLTARQTFLGVVQSWVEVKHGLRERMKTVTESEEACVHECQDDIDAAVDLLCSIDW